MKEYFLIIHLFLSLSLYCQNKNKGQYNPLVDSLVSSCDVFIVHGNLDSAELVFKMLTEICLNENTDKSYLRVIIQLQKAKILLAKKNFNAAEPILISCRNMLESLDSLFSENYDFCLNKLAYIYNKQGKIALEGECYLKLVAKKQKQYGVKHIEYARVLIKLAHYYSTIGEHIILDSLFTTSISILQEKLGNKNNEIIYAKFAYADFLNSKGDLTKAESLYAEVQYLSKELFGVNDKTYLSSTRMLSGIKKKNGQIDAAKAILLNIKKQCEEIGFTDGDNYFGILNHLGILYSEEGEYQEAEKLLIKFNDLVKKKYGYASSHYAFGIGNISSFYFSMGNYLYAKRDIFESIRLKKLLFGEENAHVAKSLYTLGDIYLKMGNADSAVYYMELSIKLVDKLKGKYNLQYANNLSALAEAYLYKKEALLAKSMNNEAIEIFKGLVGKNHIDYINSIKLKSLIEFEQQQYDSSKTYIVEVLKDLRDFKLHLSNSYLESLIQVLKLNIALKNNEIAGANLIEINSILSNRIINYLQYLSDMELKEIIKYHELQQGWLYNFINSANVHDDTLLKLSYNNCLLSKEILLNTGIKKRITLKSDSSTLNSYKNLLAWHKLLSRKYNDPGANSMSIEELELKIRDEEKSISRTLKNLKLSLPLVNNITKLLHNDESAIEFISFKDPNIKSEDSTLYGALVLLPKMNVPIFKFLFFESEIKTIVNRGIISSNASINQNVANRSGELEEDGQLNSSILYDLVWKPLDTLLEGVKKVYYSPIGLLHCVPFASLTVNSKQTLGTQYELHQMGSTKNLVNKSSSTFSNNYHFSVFGGVDYDFVIPKSFDSTQIMQQELVDWTYLDRSTSHAEDGNFKYLKGSSNEVQTLATLLYRKKISSAIFTGSNASEENLKKIGTDSALSPDVLHIATHGFYFPNPSKWDTSGDANYNVFKWNYNPLLRSGIVLAGANEAWSTGKCPPNREDGIVTAYEISQLNLGNTKLVVLSACETALGDIEGTEGVYGLQRAFKMAGVKYMLLSLWKVPDQETAEFMEAFYNFWIKNGLEVHQAFSKAQKKMQKKYKDVSKWGAWVLIE